MAARRLAPAVEDPRSASFHGRLPTEGPSGRPLRRPRTQPELLAGRRPGDGSTSPILAGRVPSKVLVNVTVQRSLGAVQVVASTDWSVAQLVDAAVRQYVKEGRRPLLPSADAKDYGLHYSQFSLECLDPEEKLIGLGSRNFFLCPKTQKAAVPGNDAPAPQPGIAGSCSKEAKKGAPKFTLLSWLMFMDYLL